jgi:type I restriction enzyme S subunit
MCPTQLTQLTQPTNTSVKPFSWERFYIATWTLEWEQINFESSEKVTFENKPSRANQEVEVWDVIFAKMQNTKKTLLITEKEKDFIYSSWFFVLRPWKEILSWYLKHFLNSESFLEQKDKNCTWATQKALTLEWLQKIQIPLPPLSHQKQIIQKLDTLTNLINLRKLSIEKTEKLTKSIFIEMFWDPMINEKAWEVKKLKNFWEVKTWNTPSRENKENYWNYIEWIKSDNINNSSMLATKSSEFLSKKWAELWRLVPKNSILVTCIAWSLSCIGNCAIVDREVAFNQQINSVTPNETVNSIFLYNLFLVAKKVIQNASTNWMKWMISKWIFQELEFIFPPISFQNKFASIVGKNEENIRKQKESLKKLEELYSGIMQESFRV